MPVTGVSFCSMPRKNILDLLEGGDRRSLGRSDQVVAIVYRNQALFPELIEGWWSADRFRFADHPLGAVAKHCAVTRERS